MTVSLRALGESLEAAIARVGEATSARSPMHKHRLSSYVWVACVFADLICLSFPEGCEEGSFVLTSEASPSADKDNKVSHVSRLAKALVIISAIWFLVFTYLRKMHGFCMMS